MYFNVSQLLKESTGSGRTFVIDEKLSLTDDARVNRVLGTVNLVRTDKGIWLSATMESVVLCMCSRCLNQCEQPISMAIEEEFFPLVDVVTGARLDRSEDGDDSSYINQDHTMELSEVVRQYSALSMPMNPVCREECAGICLTCGVNLNETSCKCDEVTRDRRWGALLELVPADEHDS